MAKKQIAKSKPRECTAYEDSFARLYAIHGNGAKAYALSKYKDQGAEGNRTQAYKLLQKPHILERVEEYRQLIDQKLDIRLDRILAELAAIAFSDPLDVVNFSGGTMVVKDLEQMPAYARAAIQSVEEVPSADGGTVLKVKFHPKVPALTKLLEYKQGAAGGAMAGNRRVRLEMAMFHDGGKDGGSSGTKAVVHID
jgi:phage terminase small subunit